MKANPFSCKNVFANFVLSLLTSIAAVATTLCRGTACERFHCSSDVFPPRIVDPYLRRSATFSSPCSCLPDWNSMFCNHTQTVSTAPGNILPEMPTICICRKFDDNGSKCQQFITRCFNRRNKKCTCCFNQPSDYCDHLTCKNGEPEFSSSNTTCICHHKPSDYPYHICKSLYARNSPAQMEAAQARQNSWSADESRKDRFSILGFHISSTVATCIVVGLLVGVILLTAIILVIGNRKRHKRREDDVRQRQNAHEALLMQRADDDRYLPSV